MKNKNGILLPETLKIILAVIGIGILCYLVFSFYGIFVKSSGLKQAEINLEKINDAIEKVEMNGGEEKIFLESPEGWWLTTWPLLGKSPNKCKRDFCVCICPSMAINDCEDKGVCKDIKEVNGKVLALSGVTNLKISSEGNKIIIDEVKNEK